MFDELKGGREEVTLSAFCPTPGWKGGLPSLFRLCAGRCGRTPNLSVSPSSQVPLCTFSFSGLIESEKLKYRKRSGPCRNAHSDLAFLYSFSLESIPSLCWWFPSLGPLCGLCRALDLMSACLLDIFSWMSTENHLAQICSQLPPACSLSVSSDPVSGPAHMSFLSLCWHIQSAFGSLVSASYSVSLATTPGLAISCLTYSSTPFAPPPLNLPPCCLSLLQPKDITTHGIMPLPWLKPSG